MVAVVQAAEIMVGDGTGGGEMVAVQGQEIMVAVYRRRKPKYYSRSKLYISRR